MSARSTPVTLTSAYARGCIVGCLAGVSTTRCFFDAVTSGVVFMLLSAIASAALTWNITDEDRR
jgi:hypothetical protein